MAMMDKDHLLDILKKVKPGIATKAVIESMTYFYFSGEEVVTYNDKISVLHPLKTDFSLFVNATNLLKLLTVTKEKQLKFEEIKGKLNVRSPSMNVNLVTIMDEEIIKRIALISKSLKDVTEWKSLPGDFIKCLRICSFAASKTEGDFTTSSIYVNGKLCTASDNSRVAIAEMKGEVDRMFIKATEINNLGDIVPIKYAVVQGWIHFINEDGCIFSIRRIEGEYPDFNKFMNFEGIEIDIPSNIMEGSDIASIFIDKLAPAVTLTISTGVCIVSIKSEGGSSQFRAKVNYKGENTIKFMINPHFLDEMLSHSTTITLDGEKPTKAKLITESLSILTALVV